MAADSLQAAARLLARVRTRRPLVHCLTNSVVEARTADALSAVGASPAMIPDPAEADAFARTADALLVNLGTLTEARREAMRRAVEAAQEAKRPWVLDPVAVGALSLRTTFARWCARRFPAVIRGNASEILALCGMDGRVRGTDASVAVDAAEDAARALSSATTATVLVTGPVDFLVAVDGREAHVANGTPLLARMVGAGCAQGALLAALCAVADDSFEAALAAALLVAIAGEAAAVHAPGVGSFPVAWLDALGSLTADDLIARARVS